MEDIFQKDLSGEMVSPDEPGYNDLINAIWDTMRLADELNRHSTWTSARTSE